MDIRKPLIEVDNLLCPLFFNDGIFQLDSVICEYGEIGTYEYFDSDDGKICVHSDQDFSGINGALQVISLDTIWYDIQGRAVKKINYSRFENTDPLTPHSLEFLNYDEYGNLYCSELMDWNIYMLIWESQSKKEWVYNESGQIISLVTYSGNGYGSVEWFPIYKGENEYNDLGLLTEVINYHYSGEDWHPSSRMTYSYEDVLKVESLIESWDDGLDNWVNIFNEFFQYNENDQLTVRLSRSWDISVNLWYDEVRITYTYNDEGNEIQQIEERFNVASIQWHNYSRTDHFWDNGLLDYYITYGSADGTSWYSIFKHEYEYHDITSSLLSETKYYWNSVQNEWTPERLDEYGYDYSVSRDNLVIPYDICYLLTIFEFNYMPIFDRRFWWDEELGDWDLNNKHEYYFSPYIFSGNTEMYAEISSFPNPANEYFFITSPPEVTGKQILIYSLSGQLQLSTIIKADGSVDISGLNPGVYVYRINVDNKVYSNKIVVE